MISIELKHPVHFGSREITSLTFREPRAKDMRGIKPGMTFGDLLDIGGDLCAESRKVMDMLHPEDVHRIVEHVGNVLAPGESTSKEPSL